MSSMGLWGSVHFLKSISSLLFRMSHFYCSIFQFTDFSPSAPSILLLSPSTTELLKFQLLYSSVLKYPFGFSLYFLFLFWDSICFKCVHNCLLNHFMMALLKSLAENPNILSDLLCHLLIILFSFSLIAWVWQWPFARSAFILMFVFYMREGRFKWVPKYNFGKTTESWNWYPSVSDIKARLLRPEIIDNYI